MGGRSSKTGGNELDGRHWLEYPSTADVDRLGASLAVADAPPVDDVPNAIGRPDRLDATANGTS